MPMNNCISLSITCFILCLILIPSPSSSSHEDHNSFQNFDVSASLHQTRHVFSPSHSNSNSIQQQHFSHLNSSSPSLSLSLHSLSSLSFNPNTTRNYTSVTLSRLARDKARVRHVISATSSKTSHHFQTPLTSGYGQGTGEYYARIGVGRPVRHFYISIDTGSDVIWIQCRPCAPCYPQSDPIFNPAASTTYKPLSCRSPQCAALYSSACDRNSCLYEVAYGDGSSTVGNFATETITFGSSGSVAGIAIGCGHDNEGLFYGSAGLLGLGGGSLSLPSQIKATSFSYCLVDSDSPNSSTLEFDSAEPANSVVAPLLTNSRFAAYRYVGLTGISVGGAALRIRRGAFAIGRGGRGGVIVDSGTTVSRFPTAVYASMRKAFRNMSRNLRIAGGFSIMDTCYDFSAMSSVMVPTVSFQFSGGKTLPLRPSNYLIPVDDRGKYCFAFAGEEEGRGLSVTLSSRGHVSVTTWLRSILALALISASASQHRN